MDEPPAAAASHGLVPYEVERLQRIERNRQVMREMGLDTMANDLRTSSSGRGGASGGASSSRKQPAAAAGAKRKSEPLQPSRRSRRLQAGAGGDDNEPLENLEVLVRLPEPRHPSRPRSDVPAREYDDHNAYRFKTMGTDALRRRIWKIRNLTKMVSFVEVLRVNGEDELAAEAEEALAQLRAAV